MDENSNSEVGRIVDLLVRLKQESGASELVIVHHQGKDGGQGARGASVLEDTPDAIWTLSPKGDNRVLSTFGRDVDDTRLLIFDPDTRSYTAAHNEPDDGDNGESRNEDAVLEAISANPGGSGNVIETAARSAGFTGNKQKFKDLLASLENAGIITNHGTDSRPKWHPAG